MMVAGFLGRNAEWDLLFPKGFSPRFDESMGLKDAVFRELSVGLALVTFEDAPKFPNKSVKTDAALNMEENGFDQLPPPPPLALNC